MAEVRVNPKVLVWARTLRGLSVAEAAQLLRIPESELLAYEDGSKVPLVGFLRRMSARYRINFASLLMPEPLAPQRPLSDFRVRGGSERRLSLDTIVAIEEVTEALAAFEDIAEVSARLVPKLNIGQAQLADDPEEIAARERRRFAISLDQQRSWRTLGAARREWRRMVEERGVFTYMIPMPPTECSGFSMLIGDVAAICINDREPTEGAKIFTLFHEYAHLILRQTGISDENNSNRVEKFCNQFAASFLISKTGLAEAVRGHTLPRDFSDAEVKQLAGRFKVSNRAMAFRLEEVGFAPAGFYGRRTAPWDLPSELKPRSPLDKSSPSYTTLRLKRVGQLHANTVLRAVRRNVLNSFDASDLLGLSPATIARLQASVG
jgi:Zn-dependent peptidase ImmA (M78 family)